jgi:hypothetical protein
MNKYSLLFSVFLIGFFACKKDDYPTKALVAPENFQDSLFKVKARFSFVAPAGTLGNDVYYYLPSSVRVNSASSILVQRYEWYLERVGQNDSLLSTAANPNFALNWILSAKIKLKVFNKFGQDSTSLSFETRTAPGSLDISGITVDTMSFTNPNTSQPWNGTTGANLFCQIYANGNIVMDTLMGPGWASAPGSVANVYPVKINLAAAPYLVRYPSNIKKFKISSAIPGISLFETFTIKIFNKNTDGTASLIGEASFNPSNYFGGALPTVIYCANTSDNVYFKLNVSWQ